MELDLPTKSKPRITHTVASRSDNSLSSASSCCLKRSWNKKSKKTLASLKHSSKLQTNWRSLAKLHLQRFMGQIVKDHHLRLGATREPSMASKRRLTHPSWCCQGCESKPTGETATCWALNLCIYTSWVISGLTLEKPAWQEKHIAM